MMNLFIYLIHTIIIFMWIIKNKCIIFLILLNRDCMNPYDKRWYRFNDSIVTEIDI
jgi:hypothetical protein